MTPQQIEALKLALEALEQTLQTLDDENAKPGGAIADTIWHSEHETLFDYLGSEITAINEVLADHAMRETQRLGQEIEQEPVVYQCPRCATSMQVDLTAKAALAQPEQEPVAWMHTKLDGVVVPHQPADLSRHPDRWEALYKTPPPCPTCEALARTVMLDQTGRDA